MAWQSLGTQHRGTKRTMGLLYIILSLLLNDEVNSAFEVKKVINTLSWEEASHHCKEIRRNLTFAVPVVKLSSMTVLDKIDFQGKAWVGYYKTYEYFLFLVCVPLSEIESSVSAKFNTGKRDNGPGMCYSLCGLQGYIGLQDNLCYCIEGMTFSTPDIHSVNSGCEEPLYCRNGLLCGNREGDKISVYKNVSMSSNGIRGDGSGCLIVTKGTEYEMTVTYCSNKFPHLCESKNGQNLYLEESPTEDQWVYTITDCQKRGKTPTTFIGNGINFVFPNSSRSWWTSVVRDLVIMNSSEARTINETPLYEGFLRNINGRITLEFIFAGTNSRKMFVACMSGKESTPRAKGADKTTISRNRSSNMMSTSTHETTTTLLPSEQPSNEQENRTNEPAETLITSATSEAPTMSRIPDVPEVPSNVTVIDLTHKSLTIQWIAGYNGGPEQTFHIIASVGEFTRSVTVTDPGYGKKGIAVLDSLLAGTRYSIYMTSINAIGSSNKTETIIIVTPKEASTHESLGIPVPGIAGGTVAGFVVILCLVLGIFLSRRYQHAQQNEHDDDIKSEREESQINANPVKQDAASGTIYEGFHFTEDAGSQYQEHNDIALEENRNASIRPPENDSYETWHPYTNNDIEMYSSLTNPETSKGSDETYENTCLG